MKTLSVRNQELISRGLKTCGRSMDAYYYIEEELYVNQAEKIFNFFQWLFKIDRPYGPANAQERWTEFMRGDQPPAVYYDFITEFSYEVAGFKNHGTNSHRMVEPSLTHAGLIMFHKNKDLDWKFKIVDQDEKLVQEFTKEEVLTEMDKLDTEFKAMTVDQRLAFHDFRDSLNYRH
jgi:hypothetical protein